MNEFILDPAVLSAAFIMRFTFCAIYLLCGYACHKSNTAFLQNFYNNLRLILFCFDALVLCALLLGYATNTALSIAIHSNTIMSMIGNIIGFMILCLVSWTLAFLIFKGRLSGLFALNLGTFGVACVFLSIFKASCVANMLQFYGNFGVYGYFLYAQLYGFCIAYPVFSCARSSWTESKLLQRFDTLWQQTPNNLALFRNYAILTLNQLHLVNLIFTSDEVVFFVGLCFYGLNVIPCLLFGLRHWHRMARLKLPPFGFMEILLNSYTAGLKQLLEQRKFNQAPVPKASAVMMVLWLGLGAASPAFAAGELPQLGSGQTPENTPSDSETGSPVGEGQKVSSYVSRQASRAAEQVANAPSNAAGTAATGVITGTGTMLAYQAGYQSANQSDYQSGYQAGYNDALQQVEQNTVEETLGSEQNTSGTVKPSWLRRFLWSCINKPAVKQD